MSKASVVLLPYAPVSVTTARWGLVTFLRESRVDESAIEDAALVVSELMSNAILHANPLPGACIQFSWALADGWLEVSVSDGGAPTRPHASHPPVSAPGGRGLGIVEHLAASWGSRASDWGATVWAILHAPAAEAAKAGGTRGGTRANQAGMW